MSGGQKAQRTTAVCVGRKEPAAALLSPGWSPWSQRQGARAFLPEMPLSCSGHPCQAPPCLQAQPLGGLPGHLAPDSHLVSAYMAVLTATLRGAFSLRPRRWPGPRTYQLSDGAWVTPQMGGSPVTPVGVSAHHCDTSTHCVTQQGCDTPAWFLSEQHRDTVD